MKFSFCLYVILITCFISAQKFYVDPVNGSPDGNGSAGFPWRTIQEVIANNLIESYEPVNYPYDGTSELKIKNSNAPVSGGDTLILLSGFHGEINLLRYFNEQPITIIAAEGHFPKITRLKLVAGKNWNFSGLTISPEFAEPYVKNDLIRLETHNWSGPVSYIIVENCTAYSIENSSVWDDKQWDSLSCNGIYCSASNVELRNNYLKNVNFGITVNKNNCIVSKNIVENFAGDGLRGLGDDLLFEYNLVKNCYDVNGNHDDGFQSWVVDGNPPERVTLRGNIIINYEDENQPYRGSLQGIGLFDGPYVDWIIENNVIMVDHWHGISMYKGINCRIVNNTVVDLNNVSPGPPWIRLGDHKDSSHSENSYVINNLSKSVTIAEGVTAQNNVIIGNYEDYFINYAEKDLRLSSASPARNAGTNFLAPEIDILGTIRPQETAVDAGAYEYSGPVNVETVNHADIFQLHQNFPNPFNPSTTIKYSIPNNVVETLHATSVQLKVFNLLGQEIVTLVNEEKPAGTFTIKWDGTNSSGKQVSSGMYFYQLKIGDAYTETKKMLLVK